MWPENVLDCTNTATHRDDLKGGDTGGYLLPRGEPRAHACAGVQGALSQRTEVVLVIMTPERPVRVINLHLTDISETNRVSQISTLIKHCENATIEGGAWNGKEWDEVSREHWQLNDPVPPMPAEMIFAGDFNDEPQSRTYEILLRAKLSDTWQPNSNSGAGVTFKTNPEQGTDRDMRIDLIFVSPQIEIVDSHIDETTDASDHQPVWATVRI